MPSYTVRKPRTGQPKHNVGPNPKWVSSGLLWLWGMPQGSSRTGLRNVVRPEVAASQDSNNEFITAVGRHGIAGLNTASTPTALKYLAPRAPLAGATEFTIVSWFIFDAADVSGQWLNFRSDNEHSLDIFSQTADSITWGADWRSAWNGTGNKVLSGLSTGDLVVLCVTVDASGARFFDNSGFAGTEAGAAFTLLDVACSVVASARSKVYGGAVFNRALSDASARSLQSNPWQLFADEEVPVWFAAAGGVSGTIAATLAGFTSSIAGNTTIVGSMAQTLANSVSAFTGSTTVTGTIAKTLDNDVGNLVGNTGATGTIAVTAQNDTSSITGSTSIVGSMTAITENATSSATGSTTILGTIGSTISNFIAAMYGSSGAETIVAKLRAMIGVGQ